MRYNNDGLHETIQKKKTRLGWRISGGSILEGWSGRGNKPSRHAGDTSPEAEEKSRGKTEEMNEKGRAEETETKKETERRWKGKYGDNHPKNLESKSNINLLRVAQKRTELAMLTKNSRTQ